LKAGCHYAWTTDSFSLEFAIIFQLVVSRVCRRQSSSSVPAFHGVR
jgi:hypothetical protein